MSVEVVSTVLVPATAVAPAGAYDLTTLPVAKDELDLDPGDLSLDTFLQRAITQASATISRYCNRVFQVEYLEDRAFIQQDPYPWQVPGGVNPLQLSRWPLAYSAVASFTGDTDGTTAAITGLSSASGLVQGLLVFGAGIAPGTIIQSVNALSGSAALSQPTTAAGTGVSFTTGISVVQSLTSSVSQTLVYGTDFTIDAKRGWLLRLDPFTGISIRWEAVPTTVQYAAGFTALPAEVADATLRLVTARLRGRGRDPMLRTEGDPGVASKQYWIGKQPGQSGALPPEIEDLVSPYRVPVVA